MSKLPLTVVINTKNAASTLARALDSVSDIASQIIVMDMRSDDKTREIAEKFTKEVYKTDKDYDYVEPARNAALAKVDQKWVLILDADEELSLGLKEKIAQILQSENEVADCFFIPRKNIIFGKEMSGTGWWPDYQMRLFKKGKVEWSDQIHSIPEIHGTVEHLVADFEMAIVHHNFQKVDQFVSRLNRYTSIESMSDEDRTISAAAAFAMFKNEFMRRMFEEKGLDEGLHGLSLSLLQSSYQLISYLKHWEKSGFVQTGGDQIETIAELRMFEKELNYWIADWQVDRSSGLSKIAWQIRRKLQW